jgi:hypothetical protein
MIRRRPKRVLLQTKLRPTNRYVLKLKSYVRTLY